MKNKLKFLINFIQVFVIIYVIVITTFIISRNNYGFTQIGKYVFVTVDSVNEDIIEGCNDGDLLILDSKSSLKKGNDLYYYEVKDQEFIIRSSKIIKTNKYDYLTEDYFSIDSSKVVGGRFLKIPKIGKIISIFETRVGFIVLLFIPIFLVFIYQLVEFVKSIKELDKVNEMVIPDDVTENIDYKVINKFYTSDSSQITRTIRVSDIQNLSQKIDEEIEDYTFTDIPIIYESHDLTVVKNRDDIKVVPDRKFKKFGLFGKGEESEEDVEIL